MIHQPRAVAGPSSGPRHAEYNRFWRVGKIQQRKRAGRPRSRVLQPPERGRPARTCRLTWQNWPRSRANKKGGPPWFWLARLSLCDLVATLPVDREGAFENEPAGVAQDGDIVPILDARHDIAVLRVEINVEETIHQGGLADEAPVDEDEDRFA